MADTTVDLPADEDIKQLAHDVVRDENEYATPLLRDFYTLLATLEEDEYASLADLKLADAESQVPPEAWPDFLEILERQGVVEKKSGKHLYKLDGGKDN